MNTLFQFFETVGQLKNIYRQGWVDSGITNPESVADHSFRMAIMAYALAPKLNVDQQKFVTMALIHDLAESIVGDITPLDEGWAGKHEKEKAAMQQLSELAGDANLATLWQEVEEGESREAECMRELDKLELALQALEYEKKFDMKLDEFWAHAEKHIKTELLKTMFVELQNQRSK